MGDIIAPPSTAGGKLSYSGEFINDKEWISYCYQPDQMSAYLL